MTITPLRNYTRLDQNTALLGLIGDCILALREIPADELATLTDDASSAFITLYGAHKAIEEKLYQISVHMKAKEFERDILENGRIRP